MVNNKEANYQNAYTSIWLYTKIDKQSWKNRLATISQDEVSQQIQCKFISWIILSIVSPIKKLLSEANLESKGKLNIINHVATLDLWLVIN